MSGSSFSPAPALRSKMPKVGASVAIFPFAGGAQLTHPTGALIDLPVEASGNRGKCTGSKDDESDQNHRGELLPTPVTLAAKADGAARPHLPSRVGDVIDRATGGILE